VSERLDGPSSIAMGPRRLITPQHHSLRLPPSARTKAGSLLLAITLLGWIAGCAGDEPSTGAGPGTIIAISTVTPPALVAFREAPDGDWQTAAMKTPTTFEAEVHGPYVVTIVCQEVTRGLFSTFQLAQTLDDERALAQSCDYTPPVRHPVDGVMVQGGRLQLGDAVRASSTPSWSFDLSVLSGTHDLLAMTTDRIALRHAVAITGATTVTPPIDVVQEGALFADVTFTATNAAPAETLAASVHLDRPITPLGVYRGPIAPAKVAPDSVLVATDAQTVSIQATDGAAFRALRRPFRVGGNTMYTLPAPVTGAQWEIARGNLAASWSSIPEFDVFTVDASGASDATKFQNHYLSLSPRFVAATGLTRASIDTDIPGYKPEWKVNFARPYYRRMSLQRVVSGEILTSSVSEQTTAATALASPAPPHPLAHDCLTAP
jgi:hypothetical protein